MALNFQDIKIQLKKIKKSLIGRNEYDIFPSFLRISKENFLNNEECKLCRHRCCSSVPGCLFPEDIREPFAKNILEMLQSRLWQIDFFDETELIYFIRPARKGASAKLVDPMWFGECIFLGEKGCHIAPYCRPEGCRQLEPHRAKGCIYHFRIYSNPKEDAAVAWVPHQELFKKILKILKN